MWPAASTVLLLLFIGVSRSTLSTTSTSCICPGRQLVYECTVTGSAVQASVWRGSALDCTRGISLLHGQFIDTGYANGTCNGGAVFARIYSLVDDRFISRLTVNTSLDMNGKEIECAYDDGRDRFTVNITTVRIRTAPFPPPTDVQLVNAQSRRISFNWTSVDAQCDSISYNITSINCGRCPTTTSNTTVTCSDAHFSGQVCTLIVQAVVCGNIIGNLGIPISVIMKVPRVSTIHSVPRYDHVTGNLLSIASSFDALDPVMVSSGYEIQVSSYSISYKDTSTGNICSPVTNIPITSCVESGVCNHIFEVSSSFCHPSTNITVAVGTINTFGSEEESDFRMIGSRNTFFDVDFTHEGDTLRISCIFLNTMRTNGTRSCTVLFGKDLSTCRNLAHSLKREQSTANTLRILIDLRLPVFSIKQNICLVIRASGVKEGVHTVEIEKWLTIASGCDKDNLSDGTVLPDSVRCGLPLLTAGIRNGLVCYTGTGIGAIATHHCFNCGSTTSAPTVRTCLPNGTWNGTIPLCQCSTSNIVTYTAISMSVVITLIVSALIIVTILFIRSKFKIQQMLHQENKSKESIPIYDDINVSEIIDPQKNLAYDAPSHV